MEKIDKRRHYVLVLDTETANTLTYTDDKGKEKMDMSNVLVYDCGWAIVDTKGNTYEERSFINRDIFVYERELMASAYYAKKIPQYVEEIRNGKRIMADTYEIRKAMLEDMEAYGITEVAAHNARFDLNALNVLQRWQTKSAFRYWFPYGTEIWDTMRMAREVIHKMPTYRQFCEEHDLLTANGRLSATAENLYRFIIHDPDFVESHTALEDVQIEREIMWYCMRQHKAMEKRLYCREVEPTDPPTDLQRQIMALVKQGTI